jgi:hypothetical protein
MAASLVPVGPNLPPPVVSVLKSHEDAIRGLQHPQEPGALLTVTIAGLPPADSYRSHIVIVSDYPALAFSDGTSWYRADTGGVII